MNYSRNNIPVSTFIGLSGAIGVGKDTLAHAIAQRALERYQHNCPTIVIDSFARDIRNMCEFLGFPVFVRKYKDTMQCPIPSCVEIDEATELMEDAIDEDKARLAAYLKEYLDNIAAAETMTSRELACAIGTAGRSIRKDFWVNILRRRYTKLTPDKRIPDLVLLSDVRFTEEHALCDTTAYVFKHSGREAYDSYNRVELPLDCEALDAAEQIEPTVDHWEMFMRAQFILCRDEIDRAVTVLIGPHLSL